MCLFDILCLMSGRRRFDHVARLAAALIGLGYAYSPVFADWTATRKQVYAEWSQPEVKRRREAHSKGIKKLKGSKSTNDVKTLAPQGRKYEESLYRLLQAPPL